MKSRVTAALASLVLFLCLAAGAQGQPCTVPLVGFGPIDPADGFPQYYLDSNNVALAQCLDPVCDPAFAVPDPNQPVAFPNNFPPDFFYHRAQASMNGPGGQTFLLDVALLGTFLNGTRVQSGSPLPLRHADRIGIGAETFLFSWPAAESPGSAAGSKESEGAEAPSRPPSPRKT